MKLKNYSLLMGLLMPLGVWAQTERVGVNTNSPTEDLDVKGTARIQNLPKRDEGVTTDTNGDYDSNKATKFLPNKVVVANAQGVLGAMNAAWPLFFYMPSVVLPTDTHDPRWNGTTFTIDLHKLYSEQFAPGLALTPGPTASSPSAGALPVESKTSLGYFITYYDKNVFTNVQVNDYGILSYGLVSTTPNVTENTYMNIIFKRK